MSFTLDSFAAAVHEILAANAGAGGRGRVREPVEEALRDEKFIASYINDNTPERKVLYEDPELGFCICAHVNRGAREANPHDHGSSWAIYGQAFGETEMSDWQILEPARDGDGCGRSLPCWSHCSTRRSTNTIKRSRAIARDRSTTA